MQVSHAVQKRRTQQQLLGIIGKVVKVVLET